MQRLSRAGAIREQAERQIDQYYALKLQRLLGPVALVHMLKRLSASKVASGVLIDNDDDRLAIMRRAADQDEAIALLDRERRQLKREVRDAQSAAEIKAVLAKLESSYQPTREILDAGTD